MNFIGVAYTLAPTFLYALMEMHQLRYFLAVARAGSFTRAALEAHVSQPSLSQQMAKLEEELGERLFFRQPGGVTLTQAGWLLLPYARRVFDELEEAAQRIGEIGGAVRGRLEIGVLPTIAPYFLPDLVALFSRAYPEVEIIMQEERTERLLELTGEGSLDLALLSLPVAGPTLETTPLFTEPLLLVLPEGHPLLERSSLSMADLEPERFILLQEGHCLSTQALEFCHMKGNFAPQVSCRSAQMETLLEMVRLGMGVSLVPAMAAHPRPGLAFRQLAPVSPEREIGFVRHRYRFASAPTRALLREAGSLLAPHKKLLPYPGLPRS